MKNSNMYLSRRWYGISRKWFENDSIMVRERVENDSVVTRLCFGKILAVLAIIFSIGVGNVWGAEETAYTLNGTTTGGTSAYTLQSITQSSKTWKIQGNTNISPWRIGVAKNGSSGNADFPIYSQTAISENITKIILSHGTVSHATVNSVTLQVYSTAELAEAGGNGDVSANVTSSDSWAANSTMTFNRPAGHDWTGRFYRVVYNINCSPKSGNNGYPAYMQFSSAVFKYDDTPAPSCTTPPTVGAPNKGSVSLSSATLSCGGITKGDCDINEWGFFYKTSSGVSSSDTKVVVSDAGSSTNVSSFEKVLNGLSPNTHYYVKAYAKVGDNYSLSTTEVDFTTPSLTATSNNNSYGSVSVSGNVITATPASGYVYASPAYTITAGNGTTTIEKVGNTFTVTSSTSTEDVNVQINFEAKGCTDHAGTNVVSGTTYSNQYGPVDPYYEYSTRQILYTKTDLGLAAGKKGTIKSIYFQYQYSSSMTKTNTVKIYMANTALTALSTSDYVTVTSFDEVYSGSLNCTNGWNEIILDTPFEYNGSGNLVVVIDDNSNADEGGSSYAFYYHTANTTTGAQLYTRAISTNADPTTSSTWTGATATNYRPNTKFCIEESDMTPLTVTLMDNGATLTEASAGAGVVLPSRAGCAGYTFAGWTKSWVAEQSSWTTTAPTIIPAGSYTPTTDENLYPVYTKTEGGGGFKLSLNSGGTEYYIGSKGSGDYMSAVTDAASAVIFTFADGKLSYDNSGTKTYISSGGDNTTLTVGTDIPSSTWTESGTTSYSYQSSASGSRYLGFNKDASPQRFAPYVSTYSHAFTKHSASTTSYISVPNCCTPLDDINGTVTSINHNSATLQWDKLSHVDGSTPYEVTVSPSVGVSVGSIDLSGAKAQCTITGLTCETDYTFTITANGASGYCNKSQDVAGTTTECLCSDYSFHYGPAEGAWSFRCFTQVGSSTEWQIEDFTIGSASAMNQFYVGYQNEYKSSGLGTSGAKSNTVTLQDNLLFSATQQACAGTQRKAVRSASNSAEGAVGTLRIYSNYSDDNLFVGFTPNGYGLMYGASGTGTNLALSATGNTNEYETEITTLTSDMLTTDGTLKYQVGIATATEGTYVATGNSTISNFGSMGSFYNSNWSNNVSSYSAGQAGKFQIWVGDCTDGADNWRCHFVPYYTINYYDLDDELIATDYVAFGTASTTLRTVSGYGWKNVSTGDRSASGSVTNAFASSLTLSTSQPAGTYNFYLVAPGYTVTFSTPACVATPSPITSNSVTLPAEPATTPDGYTFAGWTTASIAGTTTSEPTLYEAGSTYNPTSATTLYACYYSGDGAGSNVTFNVMKNSASIVAGYYVITANRSGSANALFNTVYNSTKLNSVTVDGSGASSTMSPSEQGAVWQFIADGEYWQIKNFANGKYLAATNDSYTNRIELVDAVSNDYARWKILLLQGDNNADTHVIYNKGKGESLVSGSNYNRWYLHQYTASSTPVWAANEIASNLTSTNGANLYFFNITSTPNFSVTYNYTTNPTCKFVVNVASPENVTISAKPGSGASVSEGNNSGATVTAGTTVNLTGTPDACYENVLWTVTRADGESNVLTAEAASSFTMPASDVTVTASVSAKPTRTITYTIPTGGGAAVSPTTSVCSGGTVTLPNVTGISSEYNCETFLGWTTTEPNGSGTWATTPSYKSAGATSDAINSNTTFYAVYSRSGGGASGTVSLTNDDIQRLYTENVTGTENISYGTSHSVTATDGSVWTTTGQQTNGGKTYFQLTNSDGVWLQLPTVGGAYNSVTIYHNSNSSARSLAYRLTYNGENVATANTAASSSGPTTITIEEGSTTGFIVNTSSYQYQVSRITASYGPPAIISHALECGCDIDEFNLTYDANTTNFPGSTTSCEGVTDYVFADHDDKYTICSTEPTLAGYKFTGWTTNANGSGDHFDAGQEISCVPDEDVTLYAQYERVYTVTFNNQGAATPVTQSSAGAAIDVPAATTACSSDWAFVGWSETAIAPMSLLPTLEIEAGTSTYTPTTDKTLYAIYRKTSESSAFVAGMSGAYKIKATYNATDYYAQAYNNSKLPATTTAGDGTIFYISYTAADGGKYTIQQANGKYIAYKGNQSSGANTDIKLSDDVFYWRISSAGSGLWAIQSPTSTDANTRYLQLDHSANTGFKAYTSDIYPTFIAADGQYYYRTMSCEDDFDITFHNNGTTINWAAGHTEASYKDLADATMVSTFPTASFDGWTFLGWRTADYTESTDAPASAGIYGGTDGTSGNTLTIASANVDLYPVFTKFDDNDPFDQINGGDYYIYFRQTGSDDGYGGENRVYAATYDGEKRYNSAALCSDATEFTFTKLANGKWTILDKKTNKYLYASDATTDNLKQSTTAYEWTITVRSGNQFDATCDGQSYGQLIAQGNGTSSTFMSYRTTNISTDPSQYHPVYLGSCTNRTFTTNPSTTPNIELHGQVKVTSTASKGIKAASVLTVSASNIATANLTLTSDNSAFKFSLTSNGTYTASVNIPVVSNKVGVTPIYVEYTPTATTDGIEDATITVSDGASPTPTTATTNTGDVQGRHVPANFVIAAKWGDKWYALPANCTTNTSSTTGALIEVDNASDPTRATAAPSYTKWGLQTVRPSRKAEYGTRLVFTEQLTTATADDQKTLYNGSTTNIQANAMYKNYMNSNPDNYEWLPTTTDLKDYVLTSATTLGGDASARTVSLSNKGVFGTLLINKSNDGKVRILPADFYEPVEMQVIEWKANSLVVMYGGAGIKATTQVGNNDPSSLQTLASAKVDHGVYELSTSQALTSSTNMPLTIAVKNGSDVTTGTCALIVPAIVTDNQDAPLGLTADEATLTDVIVTDGATLSAAATKYTFKNITVYPGGKLVIGSGKQMGMASLTLRGGSSWGAATYEHKYPQFVVNNTASGAYTNSAAVINYDYVTTKDQYYSFVLPYASNTKNIKYPVDIYGSNVNASNTGSFEFQYYDGAARAAGGTGWAVLAEDPSTGAGLNAGQGYTFLGMPKKIYAYDGTETRTNVRQQYGIHRIPMSVAANAVQSGETTDKNITIDVTLATKNNDSGWNLIGNPYMSNVSGLSNTYIQVGKLVHVNDAGGNWTGRWQWDDTNPTTGVRYIVTTDDGQTFESQQASTATLKAFKNFFVQIQNEEANTLVIPANSRTDKSLAPARYMDEVAQDIQLAVDLVSEARKDKVDLLINDIYTAEFDQDGDFTKMMNSTNFNLYGVYPGDNLSFIAVDKTTAANSIAVGYQVPAGGDYTLQLSDREYVMTDAIEALYVTDHEVSPEVTTDLLDGPYNFHVNNAETNDTRFTISIRLVPKTPTDLEIVPGEGMEDMKPQKFIYHDKMYILRGGVIYDTTGKKVGEINK